VLYSSEDERLLTDESVKADQSFGRKSGLDGVSPQPYACSSLSRPRRRRNRNRVPEIGKRDYEDDDESEDDGASFLKSSETLTGPHVRQKR
jgi:hypothetical protein